MRIVLTGATTAGKSSIARQLCDFIGQDRSFLVDLDQFVAEKWALPQPGLRRLWLIDQADFDAGDRNKSIQQLIEERESEFQDCLDSLPSNKISVIAMGTHVFRNSASLYPTEPRKQWWDRIVSDCLVPASNTYILRLDVSARDIYLRLKSRFEDWQNDYPDMSNSFVRWAEPTLWSDGVLRPRTQAIRDLHFAQIVQLLPHYWKFPHLLIEPDSPYVTPPEVLAAMGLPSDRDSLASRLPN